MAKLIVAGVVEGVDFTKSGSFRNSEGEMVRYGSSVKVQLSTVVDVEKSGIKTKAKRVFKLNVPTTDEGLPLLVEQYNQMIGKEIQASFVPTEGQTFQLAGDIRLVK